MRLADPIVFEPLFMERVWGGRHLETLYGKELPGGRVGESWEVVDRAEAQSVVHTGPLAGQNPPRALDRLPAGIFGSRAMESAAFSAAFQAARRPRAALRAGAPAGSGRPVAARRTENRDVVHREQRSPARTSSPDCKPGSRAGNSKQALAGGTVEQMVHRIKVTAGDCIFIPSGRVHAIGAGNVIVEVQQNSDTTYRVFDWNRVGLDGHARELHIRESIDSIDFTDFEPALQRAEGETLVRCDYFQVDRWELDQPREAGQEFAIFTVLSGRVRCGSLEFGPGPVFPGPGGAGEPRHPPGGRPRGVAADDDSLKIGARGGRSQATPAASGRPAAPSK